MRGRGCGERTDGHERPALSGGGSVCRSGPSLCASITEFLRSEEVRQVRHSELERQLEGMGRELLRKLLQAHLDLRQPGEAMEPVRDAAGTTLAPTPVHARSLEQHFRHRGGGTHRLWSRRHTQPHPLDGALNLPPEKYSLEVRRRVAIEAAKEAV